MASQTVSGARVKPEIGDTMYAYKKAVLYLDSTLKTKALTLKEKEFIGTITEITDKYFQVYYTQDSDNQQYLYLKRNTEYYSSYSSVTVVDKSETEYDDRNWFQKIFGINKVKDENIDNTMKEEKMAFAAFLPLIETAVGGVISLFGKNAEVSKAESEVQLAKQNLLVAQEATKQSKDKVTIATLALAEEKEKTAQKALEEQTSLAKQKQSIGVITLSVVLFLIFGLAFLFVKFVLPVIFPKAPEPQNVIIQEQ
ncbi:hypothetical protein LV89_01840 [Arcicella aurantiaca]|uniref:Uncharacterized protein n=1 Tax=Arcicella aurantiaca TaxID=591202 RepID=A0A316EBS3_9BACT|nr:hypothetical protein [Arcicella aurantiaca]PWK27028.1 hypothetical protein LV89_01840 [Arcicella aurantiaca]